MFNLLNKSVKTINSGISNIVSGITGENSFKTEVDFCKFDVLNLNMLKIIEKEKETLITNLNKCDNDFNLKQFKVFYVVYSKTYLNIYLITDELELKCIFSQKINFVINSVDSLFLPMNTTYTNELPIVALVSNPLHINNFNTNGNSNSSNESKNGINLLMKSESHLKLFSIKSKRVIHNFRFKKKILNFESKMNFFAIGFANGSIKLYDNDKMRNFWTINTDRNGIEKVRDKISKINLTKNESNRGNKNLINNVKNTNNNNQIGNSYNNTSSNSNNLSSLTQTLLSSSLSNNFGFKQNTSSFNDAHNNSSLSKNKTTKDIHSNYYAYINPIYDLSDSYIVYYNNNNNIHADNDLNSKKENNANSIVGIDRNKEKDNIKNPNFNNSSSKNENLISNYSTSVNYNNHESKRITHDSKSNSNHGSDSSFKKTNKYSTNFNNNLNVNNNLKTIKNDLNSKTFSPYKDTSSKSSSTSNNTNLENISAEVFTNMSKLKDWSVNQIKDLYNLRNATNLKNNKEVTKSKNEDNSNNLFSSTITLQKIIFEDNIHLKLCEERESREGKNFNSNKNSTASNNKNKNLSGDFDFYSTYLEKINLHSIKVQVPFFEDGISTLKFLNNNRYIIIGNKNSQMFFIYEIYPQSNLKFTSDIDSPHLNKVVTNSLFDIKIIYSIYRGITSACINSLDISTCKNFVTLASNKGTFHIFNLPKKDNQLIENTVNFDYKNFDKLNQKVICAKDFEKIKHKNFLYNYTYKSSCMLINFNRIDVDKNFTTEMKENLLKSKFNKNVKASVLCTYAENESAIYLYYLNKNYKRSTNQSNAVYQMKRFEILTIEDKEEAEKNYELIRKGKLLNNIGNYNNNSSSNNKARTGYKEYIEMETTEKNFSILHLNPFFTFNIIKNNMNLNPISNNMISNANSTKMSLNKIKPNRIPFNSSTNLTSHNINSNTNKDKIFVSSTNKNTVIEEICESEFSPSSSINTKTASKFNIDNKLNSHKGLSISNVSSLTLISTIPNKPVISTNNPVFNRRSNSIQLKFNNNLNIINNFYGNTSSYQANSEIILWERLICQDLEYIPKTYNTDKRIIPKNDFNNENYLQPKLIVYPNNFQSHQINRLKRNNTTYRNNSISDISSSNNSCLYQNVEQGNETESNNINSFYKNKENLLENQLKNAIETNISDGLNKKNEVVKLVGEFKIDDNYYLK